MKKGLNLHPLVEKTRKSINKSFLDKGCIIGRRTGLDIRVSPDVLDRALKIMDTLFKALEKRGLEINLKKDGYKHITSVVVSSVMFKIDLYEKIKIYKKGQDRFGFNELEYVPNGKLVLRVKNAPHGVRHEWKDGKRRKLESLIDKFIDGLYKAVAREEELKRERLQWQEEYRKEEEQRRLEEIEQEGFEVLHKEAMTWQTSQAIKAYIKAAIEAYIEKNGKVEPGSEFDKWQLWANQKADLLDPLKANSQ